MLVAGDTSLRPSLRASRAPTASLARSSKLDPGPASLRPTIWLVAEDDGRVWWPRDRTDARQGAHGSQPVLGLRVQRVVANVGPTWFGSSRPMLAAVVCSGAGRGQGTALEDFGEELGGGGEMFLVPGPYAPPQVGEGDLQLVAVVAYGDVDEGALVGS
jgi:hypothetical protein